MLDFCKIKEYLAAEELGSFPELFGVYEGSTNDRAFASKRCVLADGQTAGRGRMGRSWISGENGESIAISYYVAPGIALEKMPLLSLVAALAVRDALSLLLPEENADSIGIKWPNDIMLDGKKICGILCEARPAEGGYEAVIGIGINVSQKQMPDELSGSAASVFSATGCIPERELMAAEIIRALRARISAIEAFDSAEYNKSLYMRGKRVKILATGAGRSDVNTAPVTAEGICLGIDESGRIMIDDGAGVKTFAGGEVSLRDNG